MTAEYTQGRLSVEPAYRSGFVIWGGASAAPVEVVSSVDDDGRYGAIKNEANARRLAACWNALEGVSTDHLEKYGLPDFAQKISDLVEQRDELLEALSLAEHTFRHCANLHAAKGPEGADKAMRNTELADRMEAAIAKAEGGAT